jgi:hypothetical protein
MLGGKHMESRLSNKRTLSPGEIKRVRDFVHDREAIIMPNHLISVAVKKETDDNGNPVVLITYMRETVVSAADVP